MKEEIIEHNGKRYRVIEELEPVRGPLGGELKRLDSYEDSEVYYAKVELCELNFDERYCDLYLGGSHELIRIPLINSLTIDLETNIPSRPTFTPMTAGEAAKLPDIVGRWVAVKVDDCGMNYICSQNCDFASSDKILLIEGVDLP